MLTTFKRNEKSEIFHNFGTRKRSRAFDRNATYNNCFFTKCKMSAKVQQRFSLAPSFILHHVHHAFIIILYCFRITRAQTVCETKSFFCRIE